MGLVAYSDMGEFWSDSLLSTTALTWSLVSAQVLQAAFSVLAGQSTDAKYGQKGVLGRGRERVLGKRTEWGLSKTCMG